MSDDKYIYMIETLLRDAEFYVSPEIKRAIYIHNKLINEHKDLYIKLKEGFDENNNRRYLYSNCK